jgi:hypothetical protein
MSLTLVPFANTLRLELACLGGPFTLTSNRKVPASQVDQGAVWTSGSVIDPPLLDLIAYYGMGLRTEGMQAPRSSFVSSRDCARRSKSV